MLKEFFNLNVTQCFLFFISKSGDLKNVWEKGNYAG